MRAAIRQHLALLNAPVDVILHPRRTVLTLEYGSLEREVAQIFRTIQKLAARQKVGA
jgi:ribonuclease P protein component